MSVRFDQWLKKACGVEMNHLFNREVLETYKRYYTLGSADEIIGRGYGYGNWRYEINLKHEKEIAKKISIAYLLSRAKVPVE